MSELSPQDFLDRTVSCGLLRPVACEVLRVDLFRHPEWTTRDLADHLVANGRLTRWQANRLLAGYTQFTLGKYRLLDQVGAGGMGVVLLARQDSLQRVVAVKILSKQFLKDELAVRRFLREIQAASALDHPNIVKALGADTVAGVPFLVMEYVVGHDLAGTVRRDGPLPVPLACEVVRQVCLGLQHAADRGLVHRDVKPANVLLTRSPDGTLLAKILDFGMARFTSETAGDDLTRPDQVMGTVDFLAPEQARSARSADIRADVFGAGCTLFYLLTGRSPCPGQTPTEKLSARLENRLVPLGPLRSDLPPGLAEVYARFVAAQPADRFQTPAAAASALEPFAAGTSAGHLGNPAPPPAATVGKAGSEDALERFLSDLPEVVPPPLKPRVPLAWWVVLALVVLTMLAMALMTVWRR